MKLLLLLILVVMIRPVVAWPQGNPLGPEFRVNTFTMGNQFEPTVAANGFGAFVVVWQSPQDGSGYGIFGQRYSASGLPLGPEFRVNTFTTGNQNVPVVSSDIVGNFVILWQSEAQDGSGYGIFGQRYARSGIRLGSEFRVNAFTLGDQQFPSVASGKIRNFFAAWMSDGQDGSSYGIFAQRFATVGTPLGPEFQVNTATGAGQRFPMIDATITGNFGVVWESEAQDYGSTFGVFGQRYFGSGGPAGPEFPINTHTPQNQMTPAAAASLGKFVVVWQSYAQDGSSYGVFGQRYVNSGAALGSEFRVNTFTAGYQYDPSMAADFGGDFVVVWASANQDGSGSGIFAQRYASSGAPLGMEFRVNTHTTNSQRRSSVASSIFGDFVVVWCSYLQDGSGYGVFGQRYGSIAPAEPTEFGIE